jgi:hypothetical protein
MKDLFLRQSAILRNLVMSYRSGELGLNSLIQKVEGLRLVVDAPGEWDDEVFQVIVDLEQVNAAAIVGRRVLTRDEAVTVERQLLNLESLAQRLEVL